MLIAEGAPPVSSLGRAAGDTQLEPGIPLVLVPDTEQDPRRARAVIVATSRGRHAAPPVPGEGHGKRFSIFSAIGGAIFVIGLVLQAVLTGRLHVSPVASYLVQAVVSVELSFVLNRWLTWRDRDTRLRTAFARFNLQKTVTIALNLALYVGLLHLNMNYLVANIVLTIVFTVVNYAAGDKLVFSPRKARTEELAVAEPKTIPFPAVRLSGPPVSVVIPCRNNEATIGAAIQSLLDQDYASLNEIIVIGSTDDATWDGLAEIDDPRLTLLERNAPPGVRDANFKRDIGIKMARSDLIALVDSDIVLPRDWMSSAVSAMQESGVSCVAGGMKSIHDSFWGRYTDNTVIGAKTPRIAASYLVNSKNFGARGRKPPITANTLFTRQMYEHCAIDPTWSHGSYEDYEWFWRVSQAGYSILVSRDLFGWHHHRRGMPALIKEYRRSARGCAYFIRAHLDCPFARRRRRQAVIIPVGALAGTAALGIAAASGQSTTVAALVLGCLGLLTAQQILRLRRLEAVAYPLVGLTLGLVYTTGLVNHLMRMPKHAAAVAVAERETELPALPALAGPAPARAPYPRSQPAPARRSRLPLLAICAVQAVLSLSLVWSNTAFGDEAQYLWAGRLDWAHWLHGAPVSPVLATLSGSADIYPPLGALAADVGGLAGARILSLLFMLAGTVLLYLTASRLTSHAGALFAAAVWGMTEPVLRLAFATYDPLSVMLTALSAWLIVQAGVRRRRGELVAAAALALALANATAFSGVIIDPVVLLFAYFVWRGQMGRTQAASAAGWLAAAFALSIGAVLTATHSWSGTTAVLDRSSPDHQGPLLVLSDSWQYSGLVIVLALVGTATALSARSQRHAGLVIVLGLASFLVPLGQMAEQTGWSLDKHLAYGIWFAAIAAGFGYDAIVRWLPGGRAWAAALCCAVALAFPAVNAWESAWNIYHSWGNAQDFITDLRPLVARTPGMIDPAGQVYVAMFYTPQGADWHRWDTTQISLNPAPLQASAWPAYYDGQLAAGKYGVIALFYADPTGTAASQAAASLRAGKLSDAYSRLLPLGSLNSDEPGISDFTGALQNDSGYRLVAVGPYNTSTLAGNHDYGVFAIWQKVAR